MPKVQIQTPAGPVNVNYTISTPALASTESIDKTLPTVVFLHPVYVGQMIYHPQFSDSQLRRFNLVAPDCRVHGDTGGEAGESWCIAEAADDLYKFMEAAGLPACHFLGMSMGASIALQLSIAYPDKVASLFLVSPLSFEEPPDVAAGRQEISDCWVDGIRDSDHVDREALLDSVHGALELGFNGLRSSFVEALIQLTFPQALVNFGPARTNSYVNACVKFFTERKRISQENLAKITCPVKLVHCENDIAYQLEYAEEIYQAMHHAGVKIQPVLQVKGASHFGTTSHPAEINNLLHDFILENIKLPAPPVPTNVTSPYEENLAKCGLYNTDDSDDLDLL